MDANILSDAISKMIAKGADAVDLLCKCSDSSSVTVRQNKVEKFVEASEGNIQIRASVGKRTAMASVNSFAELLEEEFLEKVVSAAKNASEEQVEFRPSFDEMCKDVPVLDICDRSVVDSKQLEADALECESLALSYPRITNSEGAESSRVFSKTILMNNKGFCKEYEKTCYQRAVATLAEKDGQLEQSYDFSNKIYYCDLKNVKEMAETAAKKTVSHLGARKIKSCKVPVMFDPLIAGRLLGDILQIINGESIKKGLTFLKKRDLSKGVFNNNLTILDKFNIPRGLRSVPFDGDGLPCSNINLITKGRLDNFLLNVKCANELELKSNAHAAGFGSIAPHNVFIENGTRSKQDLLGDIKNGLYVTEVLGNGLNAVTGNFSQGACGFWIENGEMTYPVNEITIAGNILEMLNHCEVASDLAFETGVDSPSIRFDEMTVGGL